MPLVNEPARKLRDFAQGQALLWQQLAGEYGLLRRGLREAVDNQDTAVLEDCWNELQSGNVPGLIAQYYRDHRDVDSHRLACNARALVATALAAVWARQSPVSTNSVQQAERWAQEAAVLLGGGTTRRSTSSLPAALSWTNPPSSGELIRRIYDHLAAAGYEVTGARHWSLYWMRESLARPSLRVPVACVVKRQGRLGDLHLELLGAEPDVLIEHPEMALWPVDGSFLDTLKQARHGVRGAFSWRFGFRDPESVGQVPLVGDSAGGAAAVGFRLLAQGQPYDAGCLIVAGISKEGELCAVGERQKLEAAVQGGMPRAVVASGTVLSEADRESLGKRGLTIEEQSKVDGACRFASDLPRQLIEYFRLLEEAPDRDAPPYLAGRKPSELYVEPDVLVRVRKVREEPPGPEGRDAVVERAGPSLLPETALEVGEVYPYGFRIEEADERLAWSRVRKRTEGVQRAVVVLGPPGQGKTQLVRMTARELAREAREALEQQREAFDQAPLPVVVCCQALAEADLPSGVSAEKALRARIEGLLREAGASGQVARYIAKHCDKARCWLFLDAFDEVAKPERLKAFWDVLGNWQTRVVLTSRPYAYQGGLPFQPLECRLAPLVARQTRALVERWHATDSGRADALLQTLHGSPGLEQMGQNPLLLTLVCWLGEEHQLTPDFSRSQLYEWMVQDLLSLDRDGSLDRVRLRAAQLLPLVREIGWRWFNDSQGKRALSHGELRNWIENSDRRPLVKGDRRDLSAAEKAELIIEELSREKRVLTLFECNREPAYVFPNRSILECLAGAELAEKLKSDPDGQWWEFVDRMAWDPGWEGVLVFAAGQLGERANDLARRLLKGKDDIFRHRLALAAMCLAEAPAALRGRELVDSITNEVWNTCHRKSARVLDELDHLSKAWAAAGRLNGRVGDRSLVEELKHRIRQGDERSIELAGRLGPVARQGNLVPALVAALESADRSVREAAAQALGKLGDAAAAHPGLITTLLAALRDEEWYYARLAAAQALGELGEAAAAHPDVVPALLAALNDYDWWVRYAAARALGGLGEAAAAHPDVVPALLAALNSAVRSVRPAAAQALGKLGDAAAAHPGLITTLLAALRDEEWYYARLAAAQALGELGEAAAAHPAVIRGLLAALNDYDRWVRYAAAQALGKLGEAAAALPDVVPVLLAALSDQDWSVRQAAALVLGELGRAAAACPGVVPALLAALRSAAWLVRPAAAEALGKMGKPAAAHPDVIPALLAALKGPDWRVRQAAAQALGKLGEAAAAHPAVIRGLLAALKDERSWVREYAADALSNFGAPGASRRDVLAAMYKIYQTDLDLAARALGRWDRQGLRIFSTPKGFNVRAIAELTQTACT